MMSGKVQAYHGRTESAESMKVKVNHIAFERLKMHCNHFKHCGLYASAPKAPRKHQWRRSILLSQVKLK